MAIRSFRNKGTEDIFYGVRSKAALRLVPTHLLQRTQIKLARLGAVTSLDDLRDLRGSRLEPLRGDRRGQFSIRVNDQYRICFRWLGEDAVDVEVVDYH